MNISGCRYFESCEAPLCPLNEDLDSCIFYPDEDICKNPKYSNLRWVNRQRALRNHKRNIDIGFFTKDMLEVMGKVTCKTKGIDTRLENQEKAIEGWLQRCPRKKCLRVGSGVFRGNGHKHRESPLERHMAFSSLM